MYSKKKDQIKEYWSKKNKFDKRVPNSEVFRILSNYYLKFKKKNILKLGFGRGEHLIEFKKRRSNIFGADINKFFIKKIISLKILKKSIFVWY